MHVREYRIGEAEAWFERKTYTLSNKSEQRRVLWQAQEEKDKGSNLGDRFGGTSLSRQGRAVV